MLDAHIIELQDADTHAEHTSHGQECRSEHKLRLPISIQMCLLLPAVEGLIFFLFRMLFSKSGRDDTSFYGIPIGKNKMF
jgi:hypothetical protein